MALTTAAIIRFNKRNKLTRLAFFTALVLHSIPAHCVDTVEFNTDVLDVKDRKNIDVSQFSRAGFVMPGQYQMDIHINKQIVTDQPVNYVVPADDPKGSVVCLSPEQVALLSLKEDIMSKLKWWNDGKCLEMSSLNGMVAKGDLGTNTLYLNIPQAYQEYTAPDWDPPALWDDGVTGGLFDYNMTATRNRPQEGAATTDISGNGTAGFNMGPWRLRADWQAQKNSGEQNSSSKAWNWNRYYLFRAIKSWNSRLTLGEDYLESDLFDNFRYAGVSLKSDDNMLPPNLRGYAPEITGVAKTNAKVTVKQQGRVIYETQVASGPFRIQDLNDAVSGKLDVTVAEQDGSISTFQVDTASIPYLSRPGSVRFKASAGKPDDTEHQTQGPVFGTGEFSWGVNNGWSLYGGLLGSQGYGEASMGIGRDLLALGAISFDITRSQATLPEDGVTTGNSYRVSYSKRFEDYDSQITFAGYRFSDKNFMGMDDYLDARYGDNDSYSDKQLYTITFNKQFKESGISFYANYSHQTYWDSPDDDRFNISVSKYFDIGKFKDISANFSLYRSKYESTTEDTLYLSLSIPMGTGTSMSYNNQMGSGGSQTISYNKSVDSNNNYSISAGMGAENSASFNGYYTHSGDMAKMTATAAYQQGDYSSAGLSMTGGLTATAHGAALHSIGSPGETRLLVDTEGVSGVPVEGTSGLSHTNHFGKAVISGINSYYRTDARIDVTKLGDNVEAVKSVTQATLTEGAIGFRSFDVIAGEKMMAIIRLEDGSSPPFGATVYNSAKRETGIVNDNGMVYLTGMIPDTSMTVAWDGKVQCELHLPKVLRNPVSDDATSNLLLPCVNSVN